MRVYVAAPWVRRQDARDLADALVAHGHVVTHDWWEHECADDDHDAMRQYAAADLAAVRACSIFILLNSEKSEGKAVETGIALATGKTLIGIGPRYSNIFQYLGGWTWFPDVEAFLTYLAGTTVGTTRCSVASAVVP